MIKRSVTPANPIKVDSVPKQAPRRIFGKDLKNIITNYHNKLSQLSTKKPTPSKLHPNPEHNGAKNIRNNSQKNFKPSHPSEQSFAPSNLASGSIPCSTLPHKFSTSTTNSLSSSNPSSHSKHSQPSRLQSSQTLAQSIKSYLKQKAPKSISQIDSNIEISPQMRNFVILWIFQLCQKMELKKDTFFHFAVLFDWILAGGDQRDGQGLDGNANGVIVCVENLQLLAVTCLFISAKYEEIYPPPVEVMVKTTDYTYSKSKIIQMQSQILSSKNFNLTFPTRYTFLSHSLHQLCSESSQCSPSSNISPFSSVSSLHSSSSPLAGVQKLWHLATLLLHLSLLHFFPDTTQQQLAESCLLIAGKVVGIGGNISKINSKNGTSCSSSNWHKDQQINGNEGVNWSKICKLSWKIIQIWKDNKNSVVCQLYDRDRYGFVGGLYLEGI